MKIEMASSSLLLLLLVASLPQQSTSFSFVPSTRSIRTWTNPTNSVAPGRRQSLSMTASDDSDKDGKKTTNPTFSLGTLFGKKSSNAASNGPAPLQNLRGRGTLEPHPSVRPHISPLNRLSGFEQEEVKEQELPVHPLVHSGVLDNGLPYVILPNKSPPGRFEAHLQVFSGSGKLTRVYYNIEKCVNLTKGSHCAWFESC